MVSNKWDEAILLTEEQNRAVYELTQKIYTNEQEPLIYEAYKEGRITKEEYDESCEQWKSHSEDRYWEFTTQLEKILGFYPTKVTKIVPDEVSAF